MANDACLRASDIVPHEFSCHEVTIRSSQVTFSTKSERCSSLEGEDVSMSESHGIPEVPGRHKITTCRDMGFLATASSDQEVTSSLCSDSRTSEATEGDDDAPGTEVQSPSDIMPLKHSQRMSDLFRSGTEGNTRKDTLFPLEGKESGISINENLLLSVDLTTADLGTICDVNDNSYYSQLVLRNLLTGDNVDQIDSRRSKDVPDVASVLCDVKDMGQEAEIDGSGKVSLAVTPDAGNSKDTLSASFDERISKFRFVELNRSSQDTYEDAEDRKISGNKVLGNYEVQDTKAEDTAIIRRGEIVVNGVPHDSSEAVSQDRDGQSDTDTKNVCDSVDEIELYLQKYGSGGGNIQSPAESEVTGQAEEMTTAKAEADLAEDAAGLHEKDGTASKNRSVLIVETLLKAGAGKPITAALRAILCFTAAFILLYAPSTLINILTLYLQLLVCAIFVDIFLN